MVSKLTKEIRRLNRLSARTPIRLMTLPQYMKMSKPALIRKITKALRAMPKAKLARLCYNLTKSKLPQLSIRQRKKRAAILVRSSDIPYETPMENVRQTWRMKVDKKKRFSRKQLAAQRLFAKRARAGTLRKRTRKRRTRYRR